MATYRLIEISDKLINEGKPFWRIEKLIFGLWWSEHFEEHSEFGATFFDRVTANIWYNYHAYPSSRIQTKVIAQRTVKL